MKHVFHVNCLKCSPNFEDMQIQRSEAIMTDIGVYEIICENGHKMKVVTQNEKYEMLFALGAMAMNDGYYREAVADFVGALERFYEFCIKVLLNVNKVADECQEDTWKLISGNSERQLSAFYYTYLMVFKKTPPSIKRKFVEFRNAVVHKGEIPSYEKVFEYAEYLYGYILDIYDQIKINYNENIANVNGSNLHQRMKKQSVFDGDSYISTVNLSTLLWGGERISFREVLENYKITKNMHFSS